MISEAPYGWNINEGPEILPSFEIQYSDSGRVIEITDTFIVDGKPTLVKTILNTKQCKDL